MSSSATTFRKRNVARGNVKSRANDSESDEDEVNLSTISDKKFEQTMRSRFTGTSSSQLLKSTSNAKANGESDNYAQFAKSEQSAHESVDHEKIMETFIEKKLGIVADSVKVAPLTEDEKLYRVPEDIKKLSAGSTLLENAQKSTDIADIAGHTGIAEVIIPTAIRQKNYNAAKERVKAAETEYLATASNKRFKSSEGYYQRFSLNDDRPTLGQSDMFGLAFEETDEIDMQDFSEAPGAFSSNPVDASKLEGFAQKATDDQAYNRFKKKLYGSK